VWSQQQTLLAGLWECLNAIKKVRANGLPQSSQLRVHPLYMQPARVMYNVISCSPFEKSWQQIYIRLVHSFHDSSEHHRWPQRAPFILGYRCI
jgi:hypothetical protein